MTKKVRSFFCDASTGTMMRVVFAAFAALLCVAQGEPLTSSIAADFKDEDFFIEKPSRSGWRKKKEKKVEHKKNKKKKRQFRCCT